jgi:hypothetical protein
MPALTEEQLREFRSSLCDRLQFSGFGSSVLTLPKERTENPIVYRGWNLQFESPPHSPGVSLNGQTPEIRLLLGLSDFLKETPRPTYGSLVTELCVPLQGNSSLGIKAIDRKKHGKYVASGRVLCSEDSLGLNLGQDTTIAYSILKMPSSIRRLEESWWIVNGKPLFYFMGITTPNLP